MSICALLEGRGYRREEIKHLTRGYVARVLQHRVDDKGQIVPHVHQRKGKRPGRAEELAQLFLRRNYPRWLAEKKAAEQAAREEGQRQARKKRKAGDGRGTGKPATRRA